MAGIRVLPRVTDMRNGLFRPEVVWSNGKRSDIVFGELYDNSQRAAVMSHEAAAIALASVIGKNGRWDEWMREANRSIEDARRVIAILQASF